LAGERFHVAQKIADFRAVVIEFLPAGLCLLVIQDGFQIERTRKEEAIASKTFFACKDNKQ
jgi:hypothetical protein